MQPDSAVLTEKPSEYRSGFRAGISIAIGYVPIALTFGLLAKSTGLSLVETVAMSLIVFAGASQFIALSLIALGTGAVEIILTTFIINIRQLLFSASINEKSRDDSPLVKALYAFGITDETFTMAVTSRKSVTAPYMLGLETMAYSSWVVSSGIGFYAGAALPEELQQSMGIALYAMFIGLLVPSLKKYRKVLVLAVTAAVLNTMLSFLMSTGWAIVLATLISAVAVEFFWKGRETE
ncbi:MAG TPA: AzlC family ABC transporter permease [Bacillales bacterium]|nr:AzlC family ABC transporter permease [Bacillales bacterium]